MSMLRVQYALKKYWGGNRQVRYRHGQQLTINGDWEDDKTHKQIREQIFLAAPGWKLCGYSLVEKNGVRVTANRPSHTIP